MARQAPGKTLRFGTTYGTTITGIVKGVGCYNLIVQLATGDEVLLYKHALAYVRIASPSDENGPGTAGA